MRFRLQCCVLTTSAGNASKGIPQNHGPTQHKNRGVHFCICDMRNSARYGSMVFVEAARPCPTTTKKFRKIFFKAPCHSEMNCPAGVTVVVKDGKVMTLVQTLDCCQTSQHKGSGECEVKNNCSKEITDEFLA